MIPLIWRAMPGVYPAGGGRRAHRRWGVEEGAEGGPGLGGCWWAPRSDWLGWGGAAPLLPQAPPTTLIAARRRGGRAVLTVCGVLALGRREVGGGRTGVGRSLMCA